MKDYLADALRSQIPNRTLDEVFSEKDAIATAIDEVVATKMLDYGYVLVTTLITSIRLPAEVQESMNRIVASKNNLESARNDAEAARAKTVIAAQAKAEAMAAEGKGIADQRIAIARGIKESIDTIKGSGALERGGKPPLRVHPVGLDDGVLCQKGSSSVVLPGDFSSASSLTSSSSRLALRRTLREGSARDASCPARLLRSLLARAPEAPARGGL